MNEQALYLYPPSLTYPHLRLREPRRERAFALWNKADDFLSVVPVSGVFATVRRQ